MMNKLSECVIIWQVEMLSGGVCSSFLDPNPTSSCEDNVDFTGDIERMAVKAISNGIKETPIDARESRDTDPVQQQARRGAICDYAPAAW